MFRARNAVRRIGKNWRARVCRDPCCEPATKMGPPCETERPQWCMMVALVVVIDAGERSVFVVKGQRLKGHAHGVAVFALGDLWTALQLAGKAAD